MGWKETKVKRSSEKGGTMLKILYEKNLSM
jgi:hypothetical protein